MAEKQPGVPVGAGSSKDSAKEWLMALSDEMASQELMRKELERLLISSKKVTRVSREIISLETLDKYGVPYVLDKSDINVVEIQKLISEEEGFLLQHHTKRVHQHKKGEPDDGRIIPPIDSMSIQTQPEEATSSEAIITGNVVALENFWKPWHVFNPPNHDIEDSTYLCNVCRRIDFEYLAQEHNIGTGLDSGVPGIPLGFLRDIKQKSSCAFCRLVTATAFLPHQPLKALEFTDPDGGEVVCELSLSERLLLGSTPAKPNRLRIFMCYQHRDSHRLIDRMIEDYPTFEVWPIMSGLSLFQQPRCGGRPIPKKKMNFGLVTDWLLYCEEIHEDEDDEKEYPEIFGNSASFLRVIDVNQRCVVKAPPYCRFVALSYVWGRFPQVQYTKTSAGILELPDGIVVSELPQTIATAMKMVERLGERYLWVDALCILQDDAEDKKIQIAAMGRIYSTAVLTIAAASASNADTPLPGVRKWSRQVPQHVEKIQGMKMSNVLPDLDATLRKTSWNSRGWTYQERVLSQRTLFVTSSQLFFECSHETFSESLGAPERPYVADRQLPGRLQWENSVNFTLYATAVEAYSKRKLSFETDALDAFHGVEDRLMPLFQGKFIFGMPETEMECALRWEPFTLLKRRKDSITGEALFPSWSWAGWKGHVKYFHEEEVSMLTWITGDEQEIGCYDLRCPSAKSQGRDPRWIYQPSNMSRDIISKSSYLHPEMPGTQFRHPVEPENERPSISLLSPGSSVLRFWALSATMFLKDYDREGDMIYQVNIRMCVLSMSDGDKDRQAGTIKVSDAVQDSAYEFIALSRGQGHVPFNRKEAHEDPLLIDPEQLNNVSTKHDQEVHFKGDEIDVRYFEYDPFSFNSEKLLPVYNVLMVVWKEGIAYRLGVGKIHVDAFHQASPARKRIILG